MKGGNGIRESIFNTTIEDMVDMYLKEPTDKSKELLINSMKKYVITQQKAFLRQFASNFFYHHAGKVLDSDIKLCIIKNSFLKLDAIKLIKEEDRYIVLQVMCQILGRRFTEVFNTDKKSELLLKYPKGTRLKLTKAIDDPYTPKKAGEIFVVDTVDDALQIHGKWERSKGTMAIVYGVDEFEVADND